VGDASEPDPEVGRVSLARRTLPLLLAVAAVAAVVVSAQRAGRDERRAPAEPLRAATSLSDRASLFGQPLVARLELVVDHTRIDPARLRVTVDFAPFRVAGAPSVRRERRGPVTVLRYAYRLECLAAACAPRAPQRIFAFAPAVVHYGTGRGQAPWPELTVASRLAPADLATRRLRPPEPSPESYRLPPRTVGWALAALAILLVLGAAVAAARLLAPHGRGPLLAISPLERALALVTQATSRATEERRTALDGLALVLEQAGANPLATASRRLAWSEPEPEGDAMSELVAAVRARENEGVA
jgi:hypothetical protein